MPKLVNFQKQNVTAQLHRYFLGMQTEFVPYLVSQHTLTGYWGSCSTPNANIFGVGTVMSTQWSV